MCISSSKTMILVFIHVIMSGRKQAQKRVRNACDFNNTKMRAVIKFFFPLQGKAPKEIHAILTETLACFLPGRARELSAPLYLFHRFGVVFYSHLQGGCCTSAAT